MNRIIYILLLFASISAHAQDIEQLSKAAPVYWSGGLTWSNIFTWPKDTMRLELAFCLKKHCANITIYTTFAIVNLHK